MNDTPNHGASSDFTRRSFITGVTGLAGVAGAMPVSSEPALAMAPINGQSRNHMAEKLRIQAAQAQRQISPAEHLSSRDDIGYPNFIGSFTKALPHNALGEVVPSAYMTLKRALISGSQQEFANVPVGGTVRLANPQAAYAYQLEGADSHHLSMVPAPALASARSAGEMTELYWRAWTRDIPFIDYNSNDHIASAVADLNRLSDFNGPKAASQVNTSNIFRGHTKGDLTGPLVSQFLYKDIPFGATSIQQRYRTALPGDNHLTTYSHWLAVQNGSPAPRPAAMDPTARYIATGRDLAEYVHHDFSYQAFQGAALILLAQGAAALDDANPYKRVSNQGGFVTFGAPMVLDLVARAAIAALKAAWFQKWLVHRRLRPEAYGGLVHHRLNGTANYPIHEDVLNSAVLPLIQGAYGTGLLPMSYPEGCPTHPAYPAGHAVIAGACVTVLKAFFKESFILPQPVMSDAGGTHLLSYHGTLSVGGELDKLASNIALGRDMAGVHYRSDGIEGLNLGEEVALRLLRDYKHMNHESFTGFSLTRFSGAPALL